MVLPNALTEKETYIELAKYKLNDDKKAREKLINHNLRFVYLLINKFFSRTKIDIDDLFSIGTYGLIKAVDTFKLDKGIKFSSYAGTCIKNEILMAIRREKKHGKNVSMNSLIQNPALDLNGEQDELIDMLKDENSNMDKAIERMEFEAQKSDVIEYLKKLTPRKKQIIEKLYGLNNGEPQKQVEIAEELGINQAQVSKVNSAVMSGVKQFLMHLEEKDLAK